MLKSRFSCQIYAKLEFSWQMFEKYSSTKFHEIPSMRTDGQTDRNDEANSRFSQFDAPNKEPFLSIFSQTQSVNNTSRKFRGNSPVSSRSKPGGQQAEE
jgi:hypothetical protein